MKIPLLLHANPRIAGGPNVMLPKGDWRIEHNVLSSIINLHYAQFYSPVGQPPSKLHLEEDTVVRVSIENAGDEKELTIYAVQI